jgi:hypothetical protein
VEGALNAAELALSVGVWGGTAVAVALGQFLLGGALAVLGLGVFLRFKRLRQRRRARHA